MPVRNHWQKWLPFVHFIFNTGIFSAHFSLFSEFSEFIAIDSVGTDRTLSSATI